MPVGKPDEWNDLDAARWSADVFGARLLNTGWIWSQKVMNSLGNDV